MAFVPKVHNREAPSANRHLDGRWQRDRQARHLQNIARVKGRVDNKWGQTYNGVTETKRASTAVESCIHMALGAILESSHSCKP